MSMAISTYALSRDIQLRLPTLNSPEYAYLALFSRCATLLSSDVYVQNAHVRSVFIRIWLHYHPDIVSSLRDGTLRAVYDGSFDRSYDTAAWCIEGNGGIIRGVNIVQLGSDTLDSTRCEIADIYTTSKVIDCIILYHDLDGGAVEISCDCESGFKRTLLREVILTIQFVHGVHLDIINSINSITKHIDAKITG